MKKTGKKPTAEALRRKYSSSVDVAKSAGVSQSAVSRTFTEGASVSPKTRKKVLEAADKLGYRPSMIPRIMLTQKSSLVAIVIGGMNNPFYAGVVELLSREIQARGSTVLLFSVDHGEYIDEIIPLIVSYRVDGIISALSIISPQAAELCAKMNTPVVLFNNKVRNETVASICSDNVAGGREIAKHLIDRGGKRFGYIGGKRGNMANEDRLAGYFGCLLEHGHRDVRIAHGEFKYEGGYQAMLELWKEKPDLDAIFCASDLMAIGALEAAKSELGLIIPNQLMIAGFDDIPAASWPTIGLTTIRQDGPRMVSEALAILDSMIAGQGTEKSGLRLVPAPLVERSSTARTAK